nr:NADH dehydrogenase subunit 6 [Fenusa (Kaliofenusa) sp. 2 GYN-2022b]
MQKMFLSTMLINSIMFYSTKTPLSMGLMLMIQTLMIVINSGMMSFNFWYSYIMFLIMIGGMLILFIYISSLSSNMKFILEKKNLYFYLLLMIITSMIIFNLKMNNNFNIDIMNLYNFEIEQNFLLKMSMNKLYNKPTNLLMTMLINYLLLMLFIVTQIINIKMGPLRKNL